MVHIDWPNSKVLVTGACGTIGRRLIAELLEHGARVTALDNSESQIYELAQIYSADKQLDAVLGDVRSRDSLITAAQNQDFIFHGAALKHVNLGEQTPDETIGTNITGVQNVIAAARAANVAQVLFMSSDKAVNPTNVMGTSKLMGERLMSAANFHSAGNTKFFSTRFGNVLGSSGSVVPTLLRQMRSGNEITLTDRSMTRFVMTDGQAVELLLNAAGQSTGGEVYVTKMPVMAIEDLVRALIDLYAPMIGKVPDDIEVRVVGKRPGEKLFEELLSEEESSRVVETEKFFIIYPAIRPVDIMLPQFTSGVDVYRSDLQAKMSLADIKQYFASHKIIENTLLQ